MNTKEPKEPYTVKLVRQATKSRLLVEVEATSRNEASALAEKGMPGWYAKTSTPGKIKR